MKAWLAIAGAAALLGWGCRADPGEVPSAGDALAPDARLPDGTPPRDARPDDPPPSDPGEPEAGETAYLLRLYDDPPPPLELDMDRAEVAELLGPVADQILLLELDPGPFLANTLDRIKGACGTAWRDDDPDPRHDCDLTPLGQSFGPGWRSSPEFALVRLLTMTPANSDVRGTSIHFLQRVSDLLGIGGGFSQILSDSLQIGRTDEFLDTPSLVVALREGLLETHPNIAPGGRIPLTLRDALADLATFEQKLGPVGDHPGVLAPGFVPYGQVLGPDFRMRVVADSNIRVVDGLDLAGVGLDNLAVLQDRTGPTFDDPLELNFVDPGRFEITGLVDRPTLDLRFEMDEEPVFVEACAGNDNCQDNLPGQPFGRGSVWLGKPWRLERVVARAGVEKYQDLVGQICYLDCLATVETGIDGDPPGWAHFGMPANLGPKDQYVWELIDEVTQVGLHGPEESRFAEGQVRVSFILHDVPCGLDGEAAAEAVRPFLQAQSAELADFILGDFRQNSGAIDVFFGRNEWGGAALFFRGAIDLSEGETYDWAHPGFFADPELSQPLTRWQSGRHELTLTGAEQIAYVQARGGARFRLRIRAGEGPGELHVFARPVP